MFATMFAESSGSNGGWFFLLIFIIVMGTRQWCIWLKGNDALRGAAKKGLFYVIGNIFKK
jgi:hypothetical protein